jgi:hypothetical protein
MRAEQWLDAVACSLFYTTLISPSRQLSHRAGNHRFVYNKTVALEHLHKFYISAATAAESNFESAKVLDHETYTYVRMSVADVNQCISPCELHTAQAQLH